MKEITAAQIIEAVRDLCIQANKYLPEDLERCIRTVPERGELGKMVFQDLCENLDAARELDLPICQDTGMVVVFAEIGQEVHICGDFEAAVHEGVRKGYLEGKMRCSVTQDPLRRKNTEDNTPAVIHTRLIPGEQLHLTVSPKGFGSENMSRIQMMMPSATRQELIGFVVETVVQAGGNPCPPVVLGVGIGGDFELCAYLSKKALCRPIAQRHPDPFYSELEQEMLRAVNQTGLGPQGFGGDVTALAVNIETFATHIAGLPVAVNVGCHVTRHQSVVL